MSDPVKVAVLGGGVAGLASAGRLQKAENIKVIILEKEDSPGGLARTICRNGFSFDLGVHAAFPSGEESEQYYRLAAETMAEERVDVSKATAIYFRGRLIRYPLGVRELFLSLSPAEMLVSLLDFSLTRLRLRLGNARPGTSFRDWITASFGSHLYHIYFGPYAEKTWGIRGEELDGEHLKRRVTTVSLRDVVKKAVRQLVRRRPGENRREYSQQPLRFFYGKTGNHVLVDGLVRELKPEKVSIRTGVKIEKIVVEDRKVREIAFSHKGKAYNEEVDYVISTIPVTDLSGYLRGPEKEHRLSYRGLILINVSLSSNPFRRQWIYFPGEKFLFTRMNNYTNLSAGMSPPGTAAINLEVACTAGDKIWSLPDDEVTDTVLGQISAAGFLDGSRVLDTFIIRVPHAYPVYRLETGRILEDVKAQLGADNLLLAGRQASFSYINMDEAIMEGTRAAEQIIKEADRK